MATPTPTTCVHYGGFAGMSRSGVSARYVTYSCQSCAATFVGERCVGMRKDGTRCTAVTRRFHTTCRWHADNDGSEASPPASLPTPTIAEDQEET